MPGHALLGGVVALVLAAPLAIASHPYVPGVPYDDHGWGGPGFGGYGGGPAPEVERLHREVDLEIEQFRAEKHRAYKDALRGLRSDYKDLRGALREQYLADHAAWKARCVGVDLGGDPFFAEDCSDDRRAMMEDVREALRELRESVQRKAREMGETLRRQVEEFTQQRLARLRAEVEELATLDPFRDDAGWSVDSGFESRCAYGCYPPAYPTTPPMMPPPPPFVPTAALPPFPYAPTPPAPRAADRVELTVCAGQLVLAPGEVRELPVTLRNARDVPVGARIVPAFAERDLGNSDVDRWGLDSPGERMLAGHAVETLPIVVRAPAQGPAPSLHLRFGVSSDLHGWWRPAEGAFDVVVELAPAPGGELRAGCRTQAFEEYLPSAPASTHDGVPSPTPAPVAPPTLAPVVPQPALVQDPVQAPPNATDAAVHFANATASSVETNSTAIAVETNATALAAETNETATADTAAAQTNATASEPSTNSTRMASTGTATSESTPLVREGDQGNTAPARTDASS